MLRKLFLDLCIQMENFEHRIKMEAVYGALILIHVYRNSLNITFFNGDLHRTEYVY
jgi:hypothetical protein